MEKQPLLDVSAVRKIFPKAGGGELLVLDDIDLRVQEGEILGLLGRTGSGKSTLLRLMAGLSRPAAGSISYLGHTVEGPAPGIAMVFQSFALFPWLTVLENVELGLEALGLPAKEIRRRSLAAIDSNRFGWLRVSLSARAVRRHAPAGRVCSGTGRPSQRPLDG